MITEKLKLVADMLSKKHIGIPLLVLGTALITMTVVLAVVDNGQPVTESKTLVKGASTTTKDSSASVQNNQEQAAGSPVTTTGSATVTTNPKTTNPSGQPVANKPGSTSNLNPSSNPTPTTPTPKPTQPTGSITFSSDGCYATVTGVQGWVLTGIAEFLDEEGIPRKGGPLGDADGYVVPASGSMKVEVGFPAYSWACLLYTSPSPRDS